MTAWKINDYTTGTKGYIRITDTAGNTVADMFPFAGIGGVGVDAARANARKIVNSSQLFDALSGLMDWVKEGCPDGGRYALTEAEAAVKNISAVQKG